MKNIHLIPTYKPSRLHFDEVLFISPNFQISKTINSDVEGRNLYITSDEKFVIDEYITDVIEVIKATPKLVDGQGLLNRRGWKKIILTTDQDLIKDGVQAIDDEFLEWFVKNPSCEYVEVVKEGYKKNDMIDEATSYIYKIIIPKKEPRILTVEAFNKAKISYKEPKQDEIMERFIANAKQQETLEEKLAKIVSKEPSKFWTESDERARIREEKKQHLIDMMKSDEELGLYDETEHLLSTQANKERLLDDVKEETQRMYSEEEVIDLLQEMNDYPTIFEGRIDIKEWFEQLKKK